MKYKVTLNNRVYEVEVTKGEATLINEYSTSAAPVAAAPAAPAVMLPGEAVTAPLPGSIFEVNVKQGDSVKAGDVLFIIEAMKMENEVLAANDGVVDQILVAKGDSVETGTALLTFVGVAAPAPAPAPAPVPVAVVEEAPAPAPAPVAGSGETIEAPLPGSIFEIEVKVGDAVKAGDVLLIIEAMKMENEIVAPRDGSILEIVVSKGDTVETGTPLMIMG